MLQLLSEKSGVSLDEVKATTLKSYEGYLFERLNSFGNSKWIMPLGIFHRTRKNFGLQFCPCCFIKDGANPYFRKSWRLSLSVACSRCKLILYDRCPFCENPIAFHRVELGTKNNLISQMPCYCSSCRNDLRNATQIKCSDNLGNIQKNLDQMIKHGYTKSHQYSHLYFDVLYQIASILSSQSPQMEKFQEFVYSSLGLNRPIIGVRGEFDHLKLEDRINVLIAAFWTLNNWPRRFIGICNKTNTKSSAILRDFYDCPYWFEEFVKKSIYHANPVVSKRHLQ